MSYVRLKIAVMAIAFSAAAAPAGHAENAAIRNCNWCHGASGQGYTPAPRLAGQRPQYVATQLMNFSSHARDNPFSKMYMWGAAANLSRQTAHDLAAYYSSLSPRAANDGDRVLASEGQSIYQVGMPDANIAACVVCHGPNARRRQRDSPLGRVGLYLFEEKARAVGRRISRRRWPSDAGHCQQIVTEPNRGACVVPQFRQIRRQPIGTSARPSALWRRVALS